MGEVISFIGPASVGERNKLLNPTVLKRLSLSQTEVGPIKYITLSSLSL